MSIQELFRENLLLDVYDHNRDAFFKSLVQEVGENSIGIGVPMLQHTYLHMPKGSQWFFRLVHKNSLYNFNSTVLGEKHDDNDLPLYLIAWPEEVTRFQRREHFRLDCTLNVQYWILEDKNYKERYDLPSREEIEKPGRTRRDAEQIALEMLAEALGQPREGFTLDISGGGLMLVTDKRHLEGTHLLLRVILRTKNEENPVLLVGRVVWVSTPHKDVSLRYRHAIEFVDVSERLKDEIVSFTFIIMRERRI